MRARLIISFILVVLVSVILVAVISRLRTVTEVQSFMFRGTMIDSSELGKQLEDYYRSNHNWNGVEALILPRGQGRGMAGHGMMMGQRIRLADAGGNVIMDTNGDSIQTVLTLAEREAAVKLHNDDGEIIGYLLPEGGMGFTSADARQLVNRIDRAALAAALIASFISILFGTLLAYRLLRPVRALTRAAEEIAKGDLSQRVPIHSNDELGRLAATFNQMADSLQEAEESRRAMTADIAHELRNPLAVQRATLEALQDGIYPTTPENLGPVLEQNLLLTRLVDDLRTLALADAGQLHLELAPTDLPGLAAQVIERFAPQAAQSEINISLNTIENHQEPLPLLNLDAQRVEQILGNLLSNALRYAPDKSQVVVTIQNDRQNVFLDVRDDGPGIPAEALPHIFDRFYRADRSRSRSEGGSGLGLAIARQLAEMLGGKLTAANLPHGGAKFTMQIPIFP